MNRFSRLFMIFALLIGFGVASVIQSSECTAAEPITLSLAHMNALDNPIHHWCMKFKELTEKKTGGKIVVKVYPAAQLGDDNANLESLIREARKNGISGLYAYTSPENKAMIKLFKTLPYKTRSCFEDDMILLSCRFSEPLQK